MELALVSAFLSTDSADGENQRDILLGHQNMGGGIIALAPDHSADLHSLASWVWTTTCRCSIQPGRLWREGLAEWDCPFSKGYFNDRKFFGTC